LLFSNIPKLIAFRFRDAFRDFKEIKEMYPFQFYVPNYVLRPTSLKIILQNKWTNTLMKVILQQGCNNHIPAFLCIRNSNFSQNPQ